MLKFNRKQIGSFTIADEGKIAAIVLDIKEGKERKISWGLTPTLKADFELENGIRVSQSILFFTGSELLEKLIDTTLGTGEDEIDLEQAIGKECGVEIKHNTVGQATYANVVDIFPTSELEEHINSDVKGQSDLVKSAEEMFE